MRMANKMSALLLVLIFTLLTACGTNNNNANPSTTNENAAVSEKATETAGTAVTLAVTPIDAEPVTIEFWYGLGGKLGENMKLLIDKFNTSQKEVIVKGVVQADYSETEQKLQAAIASKKVPAAVLSSNVEWARKGYFAPIEELMAQQPDFDKDDFVQTFLQQGQVDGQQYFLPMYGTTQIMYYRKDMFEKHNIKAADL